MTKKFIFVLTALAALASAPFASQSAAQQSAPKTDFLSASGIEFRRIAPGVFMTGSESSPEELAARYPGGQANSLATSVRRRVTLNQTYYIAKRPTTVAEFRRFVLATGYKTTAEQKGTARCIAANGAWTDLPGANWQEPGFKQTSKDPVVCVSYYDALAYVNWLNATTPDEPELGGKPRYVLPTESQWEYACRAGTTTEYFWGDDMSQGGKYLNAADATGGPGGQTWSSAFPFNDGYAATSPAGSFEPNAWGLYDMLGNVWEWCADRFEVYGPNPVIDPQGALVGEYRVLRGGGWDAAPAAARCAYRGANLPTACNSNYGFRVAIIPPAPLIPEQPRVLIQTRERPDPTAPELPGVQPQPSPVVQPQPIPEEPLVDQIARPGVPSPAPNPAPSPEPNDANGETDPLRKKVARLGILVLEGRNILADDSVARALDTITTEDYRTASDALKAGQTLDETLLKKIRMTALLATLAAANFDEKTAPNFDLMPSSSKDRIVLLGSLAFIGQELLKEPDAPKEEPKEAPKDEPKEEPKAGE